MPDAEELTKTPLGLTLLAELAGLDRWEFMEQIGEPVPGATLMPARSPSAGGSRAQARRQAADVVTDQVAAVTPRLGMLANCRDRLVLLSAFAAALSPSAADAAAASRLAAAAAGLLPVARALAAAPAAQWWWEPPDRNHQRWAGSAGEQGPRSTAPAEALRAQATADEEEEQRTAQELPWPPEDGRVYSGTWWSPPLGNGVFTTTGPVGPLPAVEFGCAADSVGEDHFEVWDVEISQQARIWNITSPDEWGRLAARYPRDVTASRRHDWYHLTGRKGTWILPDWLQAARDWDGIHLSIAGYITATGFAIPAAGVATVLAGWGPDQTLWLDDVFVRTDRVGVWTGEPGPDALPDVTLPWLALRSHLRRLWWRHGLRG
jgi:hypothetical protein